MVKRFLFFGVIACLLFSCNSRNTKTNDLGELRDSVGTLMQQGLLRKDSAMLREALRLTDSIISMDTTRQSVYLCYHNKATIYASLGDMDSALKNKERAVMLLPNNHLERLRFLCFKYIWRGNKDSADIHLQEYLSESERLLKDSFDVSLVQSKVEALMYLGKENEAKAFLMDAIRKHPEDSMLRSLQSINWSEKVGGKMSFAP